MKDLTFKINVDTSELDAVIKRLEAMQGPDGTTGMAAVTAAAATIACGVQTPLRISRRGLLGLTWKKQP